MTVDDALLAFATEIGETGPVSVVGSRTRWRVGGDVHHDARLVGAPVGVLEHRPEEMTVRVRAGTTVEELNDALALAGQRSALPERGGTVGGALAVGENHRDVLARGTVRASVLQVHYVAADGRVVSGGGPTVKNVTGFDLVRLMVGALGTLGLLGEAILRTNPIPETSTWLHSVDADPFATAAVLARRAAVLWNGTETWAHIEGHRADVDARRVALARIATWVEAANGPDLPPHRWSLRPSDLRARPPTTGAFVASIGVGTVFAAEPQPTREPDAVSRALGLRAKDTFDPTGRCNPGRDPAQR